MFEEEAEELVKNLDDCHTKEMVRDAFKDGAEFGYNKAAKKMQCCENCRHYKPCVTVNETIGNQCEDYNNGCNNSVNEPFSKWELKEAMNEQW